jgi:glucose uptake protein GlcU
MKTEKIAFIVFIAGFLLKILHLPGSGLVLIFSLMTLGIIYFPTCFYFFCDKSIKNQNLALSIISGLFFSLIPIGILFKLLKWPGEGKLYLLIGAVTLPVIFIITILLKNKSSENLKVYYKNMIMRIVILTVLTVVFYILPILIN